MTEEQINKCRELSTERDNLVDLYNYLVSYKNDVWWKVVSASDAYSTIKSETEKGIKIPHCIHDVLISEVERRIVNIDEQLKAL